MAMLAVREALDFLLSAARPVAEVENIPTLEANGRVLARAYGMESDDWLGKELELYVGEIPTEASHKRPSG